MIAIVLGTRPAIIKMSPIMRGYENKDLAHFISHTDPYGLYHGNSDFFDLCSLCEPKYGPDSNSGIHTEQL